MRPLYLICLTTALAACGDADMGASASGAADAGIYDGGAAECFVDRDCPNGYACFANACVYQGNAEPPRADGGVAPPPEEEREVTTFAEPAASRRFVWVPSPDTNTVVRIHAEDLEVDRIGVGERPTIVRAHPAHDVVVVLCRESNELVVIADPETVRFHPLPVHGNALELTPDGTHAIAWLDLDRSLRGEDTTNLQEVSILNIASGALRTVTIGFRPSEIQFAGDLAYAITEDGVSVFEPVANAPDSVAPTAPVAPNALLQVEREVRLTEDGRYAVSRGPQELGITVTDLRRPEVAQPVFVDLPGVPTDIDLVPGGEVVLVMLRESEQAVLVPLATPTDEETHRYVEFAGQFFGSAAVAADGELALLYTTLATETPRFALLEVDTGQLILKPLRKPVRGVALDPFGQVALLTHLPTPVAPDAEPGDRVLAETHGYTLLDLQTGFTKVIGTAGEPYGITFVPDQPLALVLVDDGDTATVQRVDLEGLSIRTWRLGRAPEVAGVLPAVDRGFVTENHPEGRISFLRLNEPEAAPQTLSGYALNARID